MATRRVLDRKNSRRAPNHRRLVCESLEDRRVLSITVDTLVDTGVFDLSDGTSLREAVEMANTTAGPDMIDFSVNGTITLDSTLGELLVSDELTINGPGRDNLTIDGNQSSRLFRFAGGAGGAGDLTLSGLSLVNGQVDGEGESGGAISFESTGTLTLVDSRVSGNSTLGRFGAGGAIHTYDGSVMINGSEVSGNSTGGDYAPGGALFTGGDIDIIGSSLVFTAGSVTITDSTFSNNQTYGYESSGGAVSAVGDVTITGSTFTNNQTGLDDSPGGAVFVDGNPLEDSTITTLRVTNSTLTMNRVLGSGALGGGAIASMNADVTVTGSDVSGNTINTNGTTGNGGGIAAESGSITVRQSTINNNTIINPIFGGSGRPGGGGLSSIRGSVLIEDSTVSGNSIASTGARGGGVAVGESGTVTVLRSTIADNSTNGFFGAGGGIRAEAGDVMVVDSTISGNSTAGGSSPGGGVSLLNGDVILVNSTVSGNSTTGSGGRGGGVYNQIGSVSIYNSTITGNSSAVVGAGGVHVQASGAVPVSVDIINSVVAGNTSTAGAAGSNDIVIEPGIAVTPQTTARFSLIGDNNGTALSESQTGDANGNLIGGDIGGVIDPMLGPLADNGGPTLTHLPDASSLLIDAGDVTFMPGVPLFATDLMEPPAPNSPSNDQRGAGFTRVAGGRLDIGAVEVPSDGGPGLLGDYNNDTVVNAADFVVWRDLVGAPAASFPTVDGDGSETIDLGDFDVWAENFGSPSGSQAVAAAAAQPVEAASVLAAIPTDAAAGYASKTVKTFFGGPAEAQSSVLADEALLFLSGSNAIGDPAEDSTPSHTGPEAENETSDDQAAEEAFAQLAIGL